MQESRPRGRKEASASYSYGPGREPGGPAERGPARMDASASGAGRSNHVLAAWMLPQVAQQLEGRLWRVGKAGPTKARRNGGETYWARRQAGEDLYSGLRRAPEGKKEKTHR